MLKIKVIIVTIASPIVIGLYRDGVLFKTQTLDGQASESLAPFFRDLMQNYDIEAIAYTNGPGSFMAIKLGYLFFKTLQIVKNIDLYGIDGFYFNNNKPIKAIGKMVFVKEGNDIVMQKVDGVLPSASYILPSNWHQEDFFKQNEPLYIVPAV